MEKKQPEIIDEKLQDKVHQLFEAIIKGMVRYPENVSLLRRQGQRTTIFLIRTTKENAGHIIGAKGASINSLRTILKSICARHGFRAILQFEDDAYIFSSKNSSEEVS